MNDEENEDQGIINIKVTLLGDSGVGKTCIIKRYTADDFNLNCGSSIGASYSQKILKINDKEITLDLWDTAGQEKYRALGRHFYKEAFIVCLVYDITNQLTFDNLKMWYNDLKMYGEKYTVTAVVGNKSDCYEKEEVKEEEARKYAEEIKSHYFLVSAKTGDNIELLFKNLVIEYLGPEFREIRKESIIEKGIDSKSIKVKKEEQKKNKKKKKCC